MLHLWNIDLYYRCPHKLHKTCVTKGKCHILTLQPQPIDLTHLDCLDFSFAKFPLQNLYQTHPILPTFWENYVRIFKNNTQYIITIIIISSIIIIIIIIYIYTYISCIISVSPALPGTCTPQHQAPLAPLPVVSAAQSAAGAGALGSEDLICMDWMVDGTKWWLIRYTKRLDKGIFFAGW